MKTLIFPSARGKVEHAPYMQSQRVLHAAPSADGNLAYAPPAPAALLCSGTYCCSHIICFWSAFNICQKPKGACKVFCSGMEANTFSSSWKMCPCTRVIKYHTPWSFLGDLWYQIWTGIKALLTGAFSLILMASEWGPIKDTGISSNSLWWITKAFPSGCHRSRAVLSHSGD